MKNQEIESARRDFLSEVEEIIEELTADIHSLESSLKEKRVRPELVNKLFREFHSLKGISGMLGFDRISSFTHEMETLLDRMRLGKIPLNESAVDLLYQSLDVLNKLITEIGANSEDQFDITPLLSAIQQTMKDEVAIASLPDFPELLLDEQTIRSLTEYEEYRLKENTRSSLNLFSIRLILDGASFDQDLRNAIEILQKNGEVISTLPFFDPAAGKDKMIFRLLVATAQTADALQQSLNFPSVEVADLRRPARSTQLLELLRDEISLDPSREASLKSLSPTVRVDIQKLDEVINVIGDLVITKAMLMNLNREMRQIQGNTAFTTNLTRLTAELEKKLNDLQRNVIETRLVPIGQIYTKLGRIIRKFSKETNKKIDLLFFGEDTELDKIMIERLADPLMHIIRNAVDHGIEAHEERKLANKQETGLIQISAFQRGNNVVIQVQDDGRGIQIRKIEEHARKRGLIPAGSRLEMKECIDLIFAPGFSSSDEITELSGRGVGLDVVKQNIVELKGSINVFSKEGAGTIFEITLPITLAIIQALIVRIGSAKYAIPLSAVEETLCISSADIQTVDRNEVYHLRDQTLPLLRVARLFGLPKEEDNGRLYVVVVKSGDHPVGLTVDELTGQQEIVIKAMGERLKNIPGIAGAAEIGENKPILVIDTDSLIFAGAQVIAPGRKNDG